MNILQTTDIRKLDSYTIESEELDSITLMQRASIAITTFITQHWKSNTPIKIFAGPGNNGADALTVAFLLMEQHYDVESFLFNTKEELSSQCEQIRDLLLELPNGKFHEITTKFDPPKLTVQDVVIDGLFGSGLNKPLNGGFASVVKYINASSATVVSIDIPSGLMSEENALNVRSHIIRANYTLSIQLPKLAFLFAENEEIVGEWSLLDIGLSNTFIEQNDTPYALGEAKEISTLITPRKRFAHKGQFGHALLIAGSQGMAGAAVLSAKACLKSGVGLLTVHTPSCNNEILQCSVPEAMVQTDIHDQYFVCPVDTDVYQAVGVGPGLGQNEETAIALIEQINLCQSPMVVDADALNLLAENKSKLLSLPRGSVLTPHPKEMERLVGKGRDSFELLTKARDLAATAQLHIVLKGAFTAVISPDRNCWFNPTGNPGMATAGSGDVLTGMILALLAQRYDTEEACKIAAYVHGRAGDLAAKELGMTALTASDIIAHLPMAWKEVNR